MEIVVRVIEKVQKTGSKENYNKESKAVVLVSPILSKRLGKKMDIETKKVANDANVLVDIVIHHTFVQIKKENFGIVKVYFLQDYRQEVADVVW